MTSLSPQTIQRLRVHLFDRSSPCFPHQLGDVEYNLEGGTYPENIEAEDPEGLFDPLAEVHSDGYDPSDPLSDVIPSEPETGCGSKSDTPDSCPLALVALSIRPKAFGCGGYGDVHLARLGGTTVRVKRIRVPHPGCMEAAQKTFREAVERWKGLEHPNIVHPLGFTVDPIRVISAWMPHGNLPEYIDKNAKADIVGLLFDVAKGICYLHSCGIIHREIKGSNVLIDATHHARITDFGLSAIIMDGNDPLSTHQPEYSPPWDAPEVLMEKAYGAKADIFSFAMLMSEVFDGAVPFHGLTGFKAASAIVEGKRPPRPKHPAVTDQVWELMQSCWKAEPHLRPVAAEVCDTLGA